MWLSAVDRWMDGDHFMKAWFWFVWLFLNIVGKAMYLLNVLSLACVSWVSSAFDGKITGWMCFSLKTANLHKLIIRSARDHGTPIHIQ